MVRPPFLIYVRETSADSRLDAIYIAVKQGRTVFTSQDWRRAERRWVYRYDEGLIDGLMEDANELVEELEREWELERSLRAAA